MIHWEATIGDSWEKKRGNDLVGVIFEGEALDL